MSQSRRRFLKLVTAGVVALPHADRVSGAQPAARRSDIVNFIPHGQWVVVRYKKVSASFTSLCFLAPALRHVAHQGWLAINAGQVARSTGPHETIDGYSYWRLGGRLEAKGGVLAPPNPAKRNASEEYPDDPANPADWADPHWVADLKYISPGYKVKTDWENYCLFNFPLQGTLPIVGLPPCKKVDSEAIWSFADKNNEIHRQAITDHFRFGMAFTQIAAPVIEQLPHEGRAGGAGITPPFRIELKMDSTPDVFLIAAPPKRRKIPPAKPPKASDEYTFGYRLADFETAYTIIEKGSKAVPCFNRKHKKPGKDGMCAKPIETRDLDIFCPPAQMDA